MVIGSTAAEQPSRYPCPKGLFTRGASAVPLLAAQYEFSVRDRVVFPEGPRTECLAIGRSVARSSSSPLAT
jgi:hypothetical protein